jgi:hypothetical protein
MAVSLDFKIDASELAPLQSFAVAIAGRLDRVTAVAMTRSAKAAQTAIREQTPFYIDNPILWTLNSTFVRPATEARLSVIVGFKDYSSSGVPAARYMQHQVSGGARRPKSYERLLQRKGLLRSNEYAVPTGNDPLPNNTYGNIPASKYVQVLSRLAALREAGSLGNRSDSDRSKAKRKDLDFFVATIKGNKAIFARKADRMIGLVFQITNQAPTYTGKFPVPRILNESFSSAFDVEFERAVREQIEYQARKSR